MKCVHPRISKAMRKNLNKVDCYILKQDQNTRTVVVLNTNFSGTNCVQILRVSPFFFKASYDLVCGGMSRVSGRMWHGTDSDI